MLCESIREDAELSAAWLPVRLREEQFDVCSLRDMLAAAIRSLAEEGIAAADKWLTQVEQADDEEQSQSLAVAGLREIAKAGRKRLVLFVENLNLVLRRALDDASQATLRRLLMVDPFLMLIGTAVCTFEEIEGYDKALFNYFHPLHLENLSDDQICELLTRRAEYDRNTSFLEHLGEHRPKLRAIARLTGGNPRFILMAYEILSEGQVTSAVQALERLVDELTPMLKHVLEGLPPQQAKIVDALMRAGGTATPAALAQATRLKLNVVTAQLRRLKDNRMVEVLGGGKGQTAHYTVPDQLFCTWYQMRYLQRNRRRIELFTEVIRLWFEAEERLDHLRRLSDRAMASGGPQARSLAQAVEYFAAALCKTPHEDVGKQLMIQAWFRAGEVLEAAMALADLSVECAPESKPDDLSALVPLAIWCQQHHMRPEAIEAARKAVEQCGGDFRTQLACALLASNATRSPLFSDELSRSFALPIADCKTMLLLLFLLFVPGAGWADTHSAGQDGRLTINLRDREPLKIPADWLALAVQWLRGEYAWVVEKCSELMESGALGPHAMTIAFVCRALAKLKLNEISTARLDMKEALARSDLLMDGLPVLFAPVLKAAFEERDRNLQVSVAGRTVFSVPCRNAWVHLADGFAEAIQLAPPELQSDIVVNTFGWLAKPDTRESWALLLRRMHKKLPPESAEGIAFLFSVADVLEGKGLAVLDALPPEERAFALEVLERFEPEGDKPEEPVNTDAALATSHAQIACDGKAGGDQ